MSTTILGSRAELPRDYLARLGAEHLGPLWPQLRSLLPPGRPAGRAKPACWSFAALRPLLLEAGQLAPIERAERRVLVLCNPGYAAEELRLSPVLYAGIQLLLPGERAPNHRHTPAALRVIIEGGGSTTVEGERLPMERGDLLLTPSRLWHEHAHEGAAPVVWLDVLDLPLLCYLEASYSEEGPPQRAAPHPDASQTRFRRAGLLPPAALETPRPYPLLRFPWRTTREALLDLAASGERDRLHALRYVNPLEGTPCLPTLGCAALALRPGGRAPLQAGSASTLLHVVEGSGTLRISETTRSCAAGDVGFVPAFTAAVIENGSSDEPLCFIAVDDAPLQRALGFFAEAPFA